MNPQDCVWENLCRIIMKIILQEKETINSLQTLQFGTQIYSHASSHEDSRSKGSVGRKKEVIDEARTKGANVHFPSLMDICHLKNAELEAKHQKYKGRVVLRGEIVKDAVFTEQGSSATQMTAEKVMDIISRLPGCAGQAADAVSA